MKLLEPMEPILTDKIMRGDNWIHQVKWDGIRGIVYIDKGDLRIFTKRGKERTEFYPELKELLRLFKGREGILDGEIVVFDDKGKPSFHNIMARENLRTKDKIDYYRKIFPVNYIIFDILRLNGEDIRDKPLRKRIEILEGAIKKSSSIAVTDSFNDGDELYQLMAVKGWEGIVSKNLDSQYIGGKKHRDWYKKKLTKQILTVVGGIKFKDGFPKSLLLGIYKEGNLYYIGSASSGLTQRDLNLLKEYSGSLKQEDSPFINIVKEKDVIWLTPVLTCWVSFLEWSESGNLRHPQIIGFSKENPEEAKGKELIE